MGIRKDHADLGARFAAAFVAVASVGLLACASAHDHAHTKHGAVDRRAMDHHFRTPQQFAKAWNDPARDAWQKPQEIVEALAVEPGAIVADLGAGTGYLLKHLQAAVGTGGRVIALDVEPAMVEFLNKHVAAARWSNVEVRQTQHDDPQLPTGSVDAIVTLNTWHHIDQRPRFAGMLHAGLKGGGRFVIVDFIPEPTEGQGPPLEMRLSAVDVVRELEAAGFSAEIVAETLPRHYIVIGQRRPDASAEEESP